MYRSDGSTATGEPSPAADAFRVAESAESVTDRLADLPVEHLEDEISQLAAHLHAGMARWLELVAEFDRREAYLSSGCLSCAQWLSWRCGLSPRAARDQVRVARRLTELPLTRAAFSRGELSYSKARALTRIATPESESELVELALHATAAQLERAVSGARGALSREDAELQHERRYLSLSWEEDGSLSFYGRLPGEEGALLRRALESGRDALHAKRPKSDSGSAEPPDYPNRVISNADSLVAVAEAALAAEEVSSSGGDRNQLVVHIDAETLLEPGERDSNGHCALESGPALAPETARRLGCDASVVAIVEAGGEPLSVGRRRRTIPPALRRALRARDRGCRFPGCTNHRFVDAHHIRHWAEGGETSAENLVSLCRRHHRLVHEGGFTLRRAAGGLVFRRLDGKEIPARPAPESGDARAIAERNHRLSLEIGPDTARARSNGDRMDLDLAVMGVVGLVRPPPV